jgi:N-acetylmuramoyl-L-alanine amidase
MINIVQSFISKNITSRGNNKIEYIVIHDTGNKSKGANAYNSFIYFDTGDRRASADFFVDDKEIRQTVDYTKNYSWHCNDGNGIYGINNKNSIGIEICINSDCNYEKAVDSTLDLVAHLMKELNIPFEKVVRHYDASRKICPGTMYANNWELWYKFKKRLQDKIQNNNNEFKNILSKYTNSVDYWLENAQAGKTCNGEWVQVLIKKIHNYYNSGK